MALEDLFAGIGGGLKGGLNAYTWQKEHQQKDREIDQRKEVAQLRGEIQMLIANANNQTKKDLHDDPSGSVIAQQEGADRRFFGVSGNTQLMETGRMNRFSGVSGDTRYRTDAQVGMNDQDNLVRTYVADQSNNTTRRGQDITFDLGRIRDTTARRGQDISADTAANAEFGRNDRSANELNNPRPLGGTGFITPPSGGSKTPIVPFDPRKPKAPTAASPAPQSGSGRSTPKIGDKRTVGGQNYEWDGKGWKLIK